MSLGASARHLLQRFVMPHECRSAKFIWFPYGPYDAGTICNIDEAPNDPERSSYSCWCGSCVAGNRRRPESLVLVAWLVSSMACGASSPMHSPSHRTRKRQVINLAHAPLGYLITSVITPAPTVLPPSRMAKRCSFSIATGWCSSTVTVTLSPGMTISVPGGKVAVPVTSVVRK